MGEACASTFQGLIVKSKRPEACSKSNTGEYSSWKKFVFKISDSGRGLAAEGIKRHNSPFKFFHENTIVMERKSCHYTIIIVACKYRKVKQLLFSWLINAGDKLKFQWSFSFEES